MDSNDKSDAQQIDAEETPVQSAGENATDETTQPEAVEEVDNQADEETQAAEPEEPVQEEETPDESPPVSKRENLRIQALVEKMKRQAPQKSAKPQDIPDALNYKDAISADDEVIKTLEQDRQKFGQAQFEQGQADGVKQAQSIQFHTRLEIDAPKVASEYPQLDSKSDNFNPLIADALNNWYLATAGYDPETKQVQNADVRYYEFVDGIMELAEVIASQKVQKSTKNIASQAAKTSIRPDGSKAKRLNLNQAPEDMTDEELDAYIASAIPRK